jgi:hypothetical protein
MEWGEPVRDIWVCCDAEATESTDTLLKLSEPWMGGRTMRYGTGGVTSPPISQLPPSLSSIPTLTAFVLRKVADIYLAAREVTG